jgi:hypothetical protein
MPKRRGRKGRKLNMRGKQNNERNPKTRESESERERERERES